MNRERAKQLLPIIQAIADGKIVERRFQYQGYWEVYDSATMNFIEDGNWQYRIKPEPREWWLYLPDDWKGSGNIYVTDTCSVVPTNAIKVREVLE